MNDDNSTGPDLRDLYFLVGTWESAGEVLASESGPSIPIRGTDRYEWVLGGDFLHHSVDVVIGDQRVEVIELIGKGDDDQSFAMYAFDNEGAVTVMKASLDANRMTITGDTMRSEVVLSDDEKSMTAFWERSEDGREWIPWMEMKFRKKLPG